MDSRLKRQDFVDAEGFVDDDYVLILIGYFDFHPGDSGTRPIAIGA